MVHEKMSALGNFPQEDAMLLKHMILSHHGQYEFGSPKRPKTIEATVLNYLDDMDSKINGIRTHMRKEQANPSRWSNYHRLYDRYFFKNGGCEFDRCAVSPETVSEEENKTVVREGKQEKNTFRNNPFEGLKEKNLDLF
jgi:3'-5' exoribonuclease